MKHFQQQLKSISKKTIALLCAVAMLLPIGTSIGLNSSLAAAKTYKVGDSFSEKGVSVGKYAYVTNIIKDDVTGDKKADTLYVIGDRFEKTDIYYEQFYYFLIDGKSGKRTFTKLDNLGGVAGWGLIPNVELVNLNDDGLKDVQFSSYSGGTGGFTYYNVATFKGGKYAQLLGQMDLQGIGVTGKYVDGFKAEMQCEGIDRKWYLDLNFQKDMLLDQKIYDKSGKLLSPVEPWSGPFVNLAIVDGYLSGDQAIKGIANADYLSNLNITYHYEKGKLVLTSIMLENPLKLEY